MERDQSIQSFTSSQQNKNKNKKFTKQSEEKKNMATLVNRANKTASTTDSDSSKSIVSSSLPSGGNSKTEKAAYGTYMKQINSYSKDILHLRHSPSTRAWATFCGKYHTRSFFSSTYAYTYKTCILSI